MCVCLCVCVCVCRELKEEAGVDDFARTQYSKTLVTHCSAEDSATNHKRLSDC